MPTEEEFLLTIYADPEDLSPRFIFADWLEENGQSDRADFIRLQCRIANGELNPIAVEDVEYDLLEPNEAAWTDHLPKKGNAVNWAFRRGFPEELQIELPLLLNEYNFWVNQKRVCYLMLWDTTSGLMELFAKQNWNPNWVGLNFLVEPKPWLHSYPYDSTPGIKALSSSPQTAKLKELHLNFPGIGLAEEGLRALCESPYLDNLQLLAVEKEYLHNVKLRNRFGKILQVVDW